MKAKKSSAGKAKTGVSAAKLRDLDVLDKKVKNVKGGAKRMIGRRRTDP